MNQKASIEATKNEFEKSFASGAFYNKQTQDETHLRQIIDFIHVPGGAKILDLGVGSGYMSFPIAKKYASCEIVVLDIVDQALEVNRERAKEEVLQKHDSRIVESYELTETDTEIYVTEQVNNVIFVKL